MAIYYSLLGYFVYIYAIYLSRLGWKMDLSQVFILLQDIQDLINGPKQSKLTCSFETEIETFYAL